MLRNAQSLSLVEIERQIAEYATQARNGKLPLEALPGRGCCSLQCRYRNNHAR
ncbi:hypothetical protein [Escherichia coli]|uniref:hypothetical protein n=1 Tax=Escherichia coli TaxID=562 RepID=UPI003D2EF361